MVRTYPTASPFSLVTTFKVLRRDDKIETSEHLIFLDLLRILLVEFNGHRSGPVSMVGADLLADHVIEF